MDPRPNQHQLLYCNCISTVTNLYPIVKSCRVARSSVLHSKTLPQGEFISPEDFLSSRAPEKASLFWDGDPYRIRTDVNGVRGRCLNHLTNGPCRRKKLHSIRFGLRPKLTTLRSSSSFLRKHFAGLRRIQKLSSVSPSEVYPR